MQLNKVLKGLMIALPVMAIAACSSNKNASNDGSEGMLGAGTGMDANGGNGNMPLIFILLLLPIVTLCPIRFILIPTEQP